MIVPPEQEKPGDGEIVNPDPGPENPDPNPGGDTEVEQIKDIGDLVANHNNAVFKTVTEKFQEGVGKKVFGKYFDKDKIESVSWDLGGDNIIDEINFISTYKTSDTATTFAVGKITIDPFDISGKSIEDLENHINQSTPSYVKEYSYSYVNEDQGKYSNLTKAICDELFGAKEAERYIVDQGAKVDTEGLGETRAFKVVEITENGVQEKTVWIKDDGNDIKQNFIDKKYTEVGAGQKVDFTGNKIEQNAESLADFVLEMPDGSYFELCR